jgi:hypothetical protein
MLKLKKNKLQFHQYVILYFAETSCYKTVFMRIKVQLTFHCNVYYSNQRKHLEYLLAVEISNKFYLKQTSVMFNVILQSSIRLPAYLSSHSPISFKSLKQKSLKQESYKQKSLKQKSYKQKYLKQKFVKQKYLKQKSFQS